MELRDLQYFATIAEQKSVRRAAETLDQIGDAGAGDVRAKLA